MTLEPRTFRTITMAKYGIPKFIKRFGRIFEENGYDCYLVGGAVRNMVIGHHPTDYDFATNARPSAVMKLFKSVIPTGIKHGTVTVLFEGHQFEVTTFRVEGTYSNARHPDKITFTGSLYEDLKRRDFTINSMAIPVLDGTLIDPHEGCRDLKRGLVRAIGEPAERFREDGLRLMRACRFSAQLEFSIEAGTKRAMTETVDTIRLVSAERIRDELMKILSSPRPSIGINAMQESGILALVLPSLSKCKGVPQGGFHAFDVFEHSLLACDGAPRDKPLVRLAALLHDIGKAETLQEESPGQYTFYRHELNAEKTCHSIMRGFRFSRDYEEKVCLLVRQHMFNYTDDWSDGAVRRFIAKVGAENLEDLFDLRLADQYGMKGIKPKYDTIAPLRDRIRSILEKEDALTIKDLDIDGHALHREADIPYGPEMGVVLDQLLETVMDDPELNRREKLLTIARSFYEEYILNKR